MTTTTTTSRHLLPRLAAALLGPAVGGVLALSGPGCSIVEKAPPQPTPSAASGIELDVPRIMQGTVASETVILGYPQAGEWAYANIVVRGYGLVVGLKGSGSRDIPANLRAHMMQEMTRRGFGSERAGFRELTPQAVLDSMDTSVVIVEAVIPPGALEGTQFDVRVFADPRTGTTSLEGGRLYSTDLRPGALAIGGPQTFPLAIASGPLFINPFTEPGALGRDTVNRTVGRVLKGGVVSEDMPIKLRLVTPSHGRARLIQDGINSQFPREPRQPADTARGESDEIIAITVPPSFRDETDEFVALLQHTTIRRTNPERIAVSIKRILSTNPGYATAASLRWQALGVRTLPIIRDLYDAADEMPRLAALSAGARLGDALVIPHLVDMASSSAYRSRIQAIELLAASKASPKVSLALRDLLADDDPDVRMAAYEALTERYDPYIVRRPVDDKFLLDLVDCPHPMIYITQQEQPRVAIFGSDVRIQSPLVMGAWSNRLMLKSRNDDPQIEVYYRPEDSSAGAIYEVDSLLDDFVRFLGHTTTVSAPQPGLGLTYGETVGALHQIWRRGYINADFKAEQDRILAAIVRRESQSVEAERPEFAPAPADDGSLIPPPADGAPSDGLRPDFTTPSAPPPPAGQ